MMKGRFRRAIIDANPNYELLAPFGDPPSAQQVQTELEHSHGKSPVFMDFRTSLIRMQQKCSVIQTVRSLDVDS